MTQVGAASCLRSAPQTETEGKGNLSMKLDTDSLERGLRMHKIMNRRHEENCVCPQ